MPHQRIGDLLIAEGLVSEAALARALEFQRTTGRALSLGGIFLNWGLVGEEALLQALAKLHGCPAVAWELLSGASPEAVRLLTGEQAMRIGAMPYAADKKTVRVAFSNPSNLAAVDEVAVITRRRVVPAVTTEVRLLQAHQRFYARPIPLPLWTVVQKLDRKIPAPRPPAIQKPVDTQEVPVPTPEVLEMPSSVPGALKGSGTPLETILALAESGSESFTGAQPTASTPLPPASPQPQPAANRLDPYADQYSVRDFVAEALSVFGGLPDAAQVRAGAPRAQTGAPPRFNPEATMPSRRVPPPGSPDTRRPA